MSTGRIIDIVFFTGLGIIAFLWLLDKYYHYQIKPTPLPSVREFEKHLTKHFPTETLFAAQLFAIVVNVYRTEVRLPPTLPIRYQNIYKTIIRCFSDGLHDLKKAAPAAYFQQPEKGITITISAPLTPAMQWALKRPFYDHSKVMLECFNWDRLSYPEKDEAKIPEQIRDYAYSPYYTSAEALLSLQYEISYQVPLQSRFEGAWMVAPSGSGKTNALINLIEQDLQQVYGDEATVVIMDSQGMAEGSLLHHFAHTVSQDHLILLEPDPEHPLALNLFDIGQDRINDLSPQDREIALNTSQEMMEFILGGLLGSEMTKKQGGVFRYLIQALMIIPNATIFTLAELMEPEGYEKNRPHILKLDEWTRDFFEKRFRDKPRTRNPFSSTKQELYWRIDAILSDLTFRRMFSHPKNKLDLFQELQSSKVILINTNRALLKADRVETFGRYFIASLMQAIEQRGMIDKRKRKPVMIYIDEAHEYIAREPKIAVLLDTVARKNNVAFTFAHQRLNQITDGLVLDALSNVAVRYGSRNETDAKQLSQYLKTDPETLRNHPKGTFTAYIRDHTSQGVTMRFPLIENVARLPKNLDTLRQEMREKYTAKPIDRTIAPPPPQEDPREPIDEL